MMMRESTRRRGGGRGKRRRRRRERRDDGGGGFRRIFARVASSNAVALFVVIGLLTSPSFVLQKGGASASSATLGDDDVIITPGGAPSENCEALHPSVIVYNRIPKAGSTFMTELLKRLKRRNQFDLKNGQWWFHHNHAQTRKVILRALYDSETSEDASWTNGGIKRTMIVNHANFPEIVFAKDLAYINVLRDPVQQAVSHYYYHNRTHLTKALGSRGINDCIESAHVEQCIDSPRNEQTEYFCGRELDVEENQARQKRRRHARTFRYKYSGEWRWSPVSSCSKLSRGDKLKLSIANLKRHYVVGYADKLEEFIKALEKKFPDFFRGASETYDRMKLERIEEKKLNIERGNHPGYVLPNPTSQKFIERRQDLDVQFYKVGKAQADELIEACNQV